MRLELQRRREKLLARMAPASAALIFSANLPIREQESHYPFYQDSDFWYFTAFDEPMALLVLIKSADGRGRSLLFNRAPDAASERWQGRRLGQEEAVTVLGVDQAFPYQTRAEQLPLLLNRLETVYHVLGRCAQADHLLFSTLEKLRSGANNQWQAPATITDWRPWVHSMRLFKSPFEIALMRRAGEISAAAHLRAMRHCQPDSFEYHLEAEVQYEFTRQGARVPAYPIIVGGGSNACILHYNNNSSLLQAGDLVLLDAGCSYQGYAGDITRTFPINGRFSAAQAVLYDLVLQAQQAALEKIAPGSTLAAANQQAIRVMVAGLIRLGLLHGDLEQLIIEQAYKAFYMHGIGHWLGLEVHDVGDHTTKPADCLLAPGMVLTIEPGLYIAPDAQGPAFYRGMGIRIEDNLLITATGYEMFTDGVPKQRAAIEAVMQGAVHSHCG